MSSRKVKVLLLSIHDSDTVWGDAVVDALGDRHDLREYDKSKPAPEQFEGVEVVVDVGGWATHELIDAAPDVRLWQIVGTGVDHTDVPYMLRKGIAVANCPGTTSGASLAELAMMFILMLARKFHEATDSLKCGLLGMPFGVSLSGRVLGLVGFGASGRELARRAKSFGMRIHAIDALPIPQEILDDIQPDSVGTADDLDGLVAESDFLSLHLPLTKATCGIIDARRLAMMKPSACLINVARGALVDEAALYEALLEGTLGGAGLDVFSDEPVDPSLAVYRLPNVVITPHLAGSSDDSVRRRAAVALENVDRIARGLEPVYRVGDGYT